MEPLPEEYMGQEKEGERPITSEFIQMMKKIMPTVLRQDASHLTMRNLCTEAGMELQPFYTLVTANVYKSPRPLAKALMLDKAEHLLTTTDKDIATIADECGFVSANYFIASFYRWKNHTPLDYRELYKSRKVLNVG